MYYLNFETMKQVMREHQKTGSISAEVPAKVFGLTGSCRVEILLRAGKVTSCFIVSSHGHRIKEEETSRKLARLGNLSWTFIAQEDLTVQPVSPALAPPTTATPIPEPAPILDFPQRTVALEPWQMSSWPRLHRQVFALADGSRTILKIAEVLSASPEITRGVLRDLHSIGAISMSPLKRT